ncbi:aaRS-interacting multifunctional protein 2 isoform X2 [Rhodnius prolixus]
MQSDGIAMYRLKPVFELKEISVPTNMYKMRNLQSTGIINCSDTATNGTGLEDDTGLEKIRKRQEILLLKLAEIKKILSTLKDELHAPKIATVGSGTLNMCNKPNFTEFGITHDVVLNISVARQYPPYSLLAIDKIWPEIVMKFSWHLHSSAPDLPLAFKQFQEHLDNKVLDREPDLNIRVVWKVADTDCEFIISPIKSVPLIGEVNFLRFLGASLSNNNDVVTQTLIDEKLDACYCLSRCNNTNDDVKTYLQILSNGLEQNTQWLCGEKVTVVDLAAWSVFKQMKKLNFCFPLLSNWFEKCNKYLDV